jgi:threonine/homoserine/homoserine lactone efflux protein
MSGPARRAPAQRFRSHEAKGVTAGTALIAYTFAAALVTITPGLDTALVLHTVASRGAKAAWHASLGIALGCLTWGLLAAGGISAVLLASASLFTALKLAGALYLVWLGVGLLRRPGAQVGVDRAEAGSRPFRRGLLTNLLNPKVGLFYVAFLPQFIPAGAPLLVMTLAMTFIHALLGLIWFALLIALARQANNLLGRPGVLGWIERITGGLFVGLGLKLAFDTR